MMSPKLCHGKHGFFLLQTSNNNSEQQTNDYNCEYTMAAKKNLK